MQCRVFCSLTLSAAILIPAASRAATLLVPSQFPTIQSAINAAVDGDEVIIADGVHTGPGNRDIRFLGKAITVRSASGDAALCVIDCEHAAPGVRFDGGENQNTILMRITILRALGGITIMAAEPTILGCRIIQSQGAGVTVAGDSLREPRLIDCQISECTSTTLAAGLKCGGRVHLSGCTISNNVGGIFGGGVHVGITSDLTALNCSIVGNASRMGAGIYAHGGSIHLRACTLRGNVAGSTEYPYGLGGAVYAFQTTGQVVQCLIEDNHARFSSGGAAYLEAAAFSFLNCVVRANRGGSGGAIYADGSQIDATGCSFTDNVDAAIALFYSSIDAVNCTFAGNRDEIGGGSAIYGILQTGAIGAFRNCLFAEGPGAVSTGLKNGSQFSYSLASGGFAGPGNINAAPQFVDADGPDNDPLTWQDNDYRIPPGAPGVDAGDNTAVPLDVFDLNGDFDFSERLPLDAAGLVRFTDDLDTPDTGVGPPPVVDIGAFEFQAPSSCRGDMNCDLYVNFADIDRFVEALDTPTGNNWPHLCPWLHADSNIDGLVNFADIDAFVARLGTSCL